MTPELDPCFPPALPRLRVRKGRGDANRCMLVLLSMPRLRHATEATCWRLLRVLFVRDSAMPANPARPLLPKLTAPGAASSRLGIVRYGVVCRMAALASSASITDSRAPFPRHACSANLRARAFFPIFIAPAPRSPVAQERARAPVRPLDAGGLNRPENYQGPEGTQTGCPPWRLWLQMKKPPCPGGSGGLVSRHGG
jgi:hypothetical protein